MIEQRKGFDVSFALGEISNSRTVNSDGSVSSKSFFFVDGWLSYLSSALVCEGKSQRFLDAIVKKAIHRKQNWGSDEFLAECNIQAKKKNEESMIFHVAFPLWPIGQKVSGQRAVGNWTVCFDDQDNFELAKSISSERKKYFEKLIAEHRAIAENATGLKLAFCKVRAVDVFDAYQTAEQVLSTALGVYALFLKRGKQILPKNPKKPAGLVLVAPFTTVHLEGGVLASEVFWYDRWLETPSKNTIDDATWGKISNWADTVWASVEKSKWRRNSESALVKYFRAVSASDPEKAFLELWMLLEYIGGDENTKGDTLVKRASTFFEDEDAWRQIGKHLQFRRNAISHGKRIDTDDSESILFQMDEFLMPMLNAFVNNPFEFKDLAEFYQFCDLPSDPNLRKRRAYLLDCASKFRHEGED